MKLTVKDPPRRFAVGTSIRREIADCATVALAADEQITLVTESGAEFDVARKDWGFYATPSLNGRLEGFGLRGALIRNRVTGRYFVVLVERGHEPAFERYLDEESCAVIAWMDSGERLDALRTRLAGSDRE